MKTFEELGLSAEVLRTLSNLGIEVPTEIQEKTIPLVLTGRDVIGGAATGSGKTLAFASGIVENLQKNGRVQALILTPTRELAEQVASSIKDFSKYKDLNVLPVYGGVNMDMQIRRIRNTDVIVGTPGRILDHLRRDTLDLRDVRFLVLDEVDRMLDMGFREDVEMIIDRCPKKRQTMLFSATISSDLDYLAKRHTHNPAEISVNSHIDPSLLKQIYYNVPDGLKFSLLVHLLKKETRNLVMVFCGTRRNVDFVVNNLNNFGIKARGIHGGMVQNKRNKVLGEFNSKEGVNVLICTDVAARGLDIPGVSHVYNYDLSKTSAEYIHRIGRTARAGRDGIAISILCSRDYENFSNILMDEELKIEEVPTPWFERVRILVEPKKSFGARPGGRNSPGMRKHSRFKSNDRRPERREDSDRRPRTNYGKRPQRGRDDEKSYGRGKPQSSRSFNRRKRNFGRGNWRG